MQLFAVERDRWKGRVSAALFWIVLTQNNLSAFFLNEGIIYLAVVQVWIQQFSEQ